MSTPAPPAPPPAPCAPPGEPAPVSHRAQPWPAGPEPGVPYMLALSLMLMGNTSVDWLMNSMVPLTLRHFTANAILLAGIPDIHRLFGFIIEPYVAWKGDRVQTRYGRRRPFLLVGIPAALVMNLVFGAMPFVLRDEAFRHTVGALVIMVSVYVILQVFVEINFGCYGPMWGDSFPQHKLGRVNSVNHICGQLLNLFMAYFVMSWADASEIWPYVVSSGLLLVSWIVAVFVYREAPRTIPPEMKRERFRLVGQLSILLQSADYLKLAVLSSLAALNVTCFRVFTALFATETLGLSKGDYGKASSLAPLIALATIWPVGHLTDRLGPKYLILAGFSLSTINAVCMGLYVHDFNTLLVCNTLDTFATIMVFLPMPAMIFQFAPDNQRGMVYGLMQFVRSVLAFLMALLTGVAVELFHHEYRVAYAMGFVLALSAACVTLTTRSPKYGKGRTAPG